MRVTISCKVIEPSAWPHSPQFPAHMVALHPSSVFKLSKVSHRAVPLNATFLHKPSRIPVFRSAKPFVRTNSHFAITCRKTHYCRHIRILHHNRWRRLTLKHTIIHHLRHRLVQHFLDRHYHHPHCHNALDTFYSY